MAKLASRTPAFGQFLAACRGKRSVRAVVLALHARGYDLDHTALWKMEHGQTPKIESLIAICAAYALDFRDTCARVAAEITGKPVPTETPLSEAARRLALAFDGWSHEKQAAILTLAGVAPADPPRLRAPRAAG